MKRSFGIKAVGVAMAALLNATVLTPANAQHGQDLGPINVVDPWLKAWQDATPENPPTPPTPGVDYGMDPETGAFRHPVATPLTTSAPSFPGQLDHWDQKSYAKNVHVVGFYPAVTSPWHAWASVVDFEGKRFLYTHDRDYLRIMDVTDPRQAKDRLVAGRRLERRRL